MQTNVKVFTPELLVDIFGDVKVEGDFTFKLKIDEITNRDISKLSKINDEYGMNFHIKRSGNGLVIFATAPYGNGERAQPKGKVFETIRDFFEFELPDEARLFAFQNTNIERLDWKAKSLWRAVSMAFVFSETPQGADYWQDVISKSFEKYKI